MVSFTVILSYCEKDMKNDGLITERALSSASPGLTAVRIAFPVKIVFIFVDYERTSSFLPGLATTSSTYTLEWRMVIQGASTRDANCSVA